jgi:hypothetical protein
MTTNPMMTRQQAAAFGSYARDDVEGYAPANENRTRWMMNRDAAEMERWAASRPEWGQQAYQARMQAQQMRQRARRQPR